MGQFEKLWEFLMNFIHSRKIPTVEFFSFIFLKLFVLSFRNPFSTPYFDLIFQQWLINFQEKGLKKLSYIIISSYSWRSIFLWFFFDSFWWWICRRVRKRWDYGLEWLFEWAAWQNTLNCPRHTSLLANKLLKLQILLLSWRPHRALKSL